MSSRARVLVILGITVAVIGGAIVYSIARFQAWHRDGWAGVLYQPSFPESRKGSLQTGQARPGEVLMTFSSAAARFKAGDRVLYVNGIPIEDIPRLRRMETSLSRGSVIVYRVLRGGKQLDIPIPLVSPFRSTFVILKVVIAFVVAATFIVVALMVFLRLPDDRRAVVFYAFALVSALMILGAAALQYEQTGGRGVLPNFGGGAFSSVIYFICLFAYAPLVLHLALIFPRERPILERRPYLLRWIYAGAAIAALIVVVVSFLILQLMQDPANLKELASKIDRIFETVFGIMTIGGLLLALQVIWTGRREGVVAAFAHRPFRSAFALFGIALGVSKVVGSYGVKVIGVLTGAFACALPILLVASYPVFACVALARSYRAAGVEEKRQVQWPLWALLIALLTKIIAMLITMSLGMYAQMTHMALMEWRGVVTILNVIPTPVSIIIPLSFAAAILKYRLMNIDIIVRKTVVYAILSGAIILMYLVLVGGLGTLLVNVAGVTNQSTVIASTLVVALMFVPLRNKLQTLVDRNLFRHKYDYPQALRSIAGETLAANDLGAFLTSAAEKVQQALQNRAVMIFVPRHDELVAAAKIGVADSLLGTMRMQRAPFVSLLDRPFDPARRPVPDDAAVVLKHIEAVLVVPVNTPGTPPNGFIALAAKLSGAPFDVEDIDFLRSVADQLDIGMDRIRQQREEADYEQARTIQQSLLPREMPRVAGVELSGTWQPARTMGGDYYDVLKLSESEIAVCIGDVAGKGMPAALLMSGLQAAVRASASGSPRDLCERVRRVVVSSLSGGRFVTFFYATIDTAAMRLRWCNAGHNAPILARADGSVVRLAEGGPAFSRLFREDAYTEKEIAIAPGDRLVLFTDGVSEASGGDGEMFGETRLELLVAEKRALSATELQQSIAGAATAFSGGELDDDLTLVVAAVV